jgi:hypothetical protein
MRKLAFLFIMLLASTAFATTHTVKHGRLRYALIMGGFHPAKADLLIADFANMLYYDTAAELLAATPSEGRMGWAVDTNALYFYTGAAWVALGSASGILGTNGGTIGNETNNVWTIAENDENITLTFASNLVTLASGTSATFAITPAIAFAGDATFNGGAGAVTFGAASSSIVVPDDSATALVLGSAGRLNLLGFDTQDDQEKVIVKGYTGTNSFHVDIGDAQFDEDLAIGAGASGVDYVLTFNGEDNDGTLTWMEDEARLDIASHVLIGAGAADTDYAITLYGEDNNGSIVWMEDEARLDLESHVEVGAGAADTDYALSFNGEDNDGSIVWMEDEARLDLESHVEVGAGAADTDYVLSFNGEDNDGSIVWMEDEARLDIASHVLIGAGAADTDYAITLYGEDNNGSIVWMEDEARLDLESHVEVGAGAADTDYVLSFDGEDNDGSITYMEDEDRLDFDNDIAVGGSAAVAGGMTVVSQTIGISFDSMRVFDDPSSLLPAAGATDDLGHVIGTPGTNADSLQTEDLKAEGGNPTLNKAGFSFVIPPSYLAGSTVTLVANAGMITTAADDAATLLFECWVPDYANADGSVSADLVAGGAQSINNTTFADKSFVVDDDATDHELAAGSVVQCIMTTSVSDGSTGTAVIAAIRQLSVVISS